MKLLFSFQKSKRFLVALHTRARIEIPIDSRGNAFIDVALHTRARIEMRWIAVSAA